MTGPDTRREIVQIGLDGASRPMLRYRDEMHLPDHRRSIVSSGDAGRADALAGRRDESRYDASLDYRDGWKSGEQERWLSVAEAEEQQQ